MDEKDYTQDVETSGHGEDKDKQKEEDRYERCVTCAGGLRARPVP